MVFQLAITGGFRTGKDTLASIMLNLFGPEVTTQLAFADALKEELARITYDTVARPDMARRGIAPSRGDFEAWLAMERDARTRNGPGWQWWGEYRRQTCGQDYWIRHLDFRKRIARAALLEHNLILADMRYHNECEWAKDFGFYTVRVEGPCRAQDPRDPNHSSERHIKELGVDLVIDNSGTLDDLHRAAVSVLWPILLDREKAKG